MASYSAQTLINIALTNLGILEQGGVPNASDSNASLVLLNLMIQQWHLQDKFIWSVGTASYALTASVGVYPIGTGASSPFNVARPTFVQQALIGLPGPNPSNQITYPLRIITQQEYGLISDLKALAHIPQVLYNDYASPTSNLYLWPVPRASLTTNLILSTWAQLGAFAALATTVDLPDGYPEAITNALGVRLLPMFGVAVQPQVASLVSALAQQGEAAIAELNARTRIAMPPAGPAAEESPK